MKKLFSVICVIIVLVFCRPAMAETLTVTATVDTVFSLNGYTAPNSLVTFSENNAVIGTSVSDASGHFEKTFNNQSSGIHTVDIFSTNPDNINTLTVSYQFLLLQNQSLAISNVYLPPSISTSQTTYYDNQIVTVMGYAVPSSPIRIDITGSGSQTGNINSQSNGSYSYSISASALGAGNYQTTATLDVISATATTSAVATFTIVHLASATPTPTPTSEPSSSSTATATLPPATPTPTAGVTVTVTSSPVCPYPFPNICFFDTKRLGFLDVDGKPFLDFLISFINNFGKKLSLAVDINGDRVVDSKDFSIILYYARSLTDKIQKVYVSPNTTSPALDLSFRADQLNGEKLPSEWSPLWIISALILSIIFGFLLRTIIFKSRRTFAFFVIFLTIFLVIVLGYFLNIRHAYFVAPVKNKAAIGQEFYFDVNVASGSVPINVVQADIRFDNRLLQVVKIETQDSFATIFTHKDFSNKEGRIRIIGGLPNPGYLGGERRFARIYFFAKKAGSAGIDFLKSSRLLENDGNGTDVLNIFPRTTIQIGR